MKISIVDRCGLLDRDTADRFERRLLFALARFGPKIEQVLVNIDHFDDPRSGDSKRCEIRVTLRGLSEVMVISNDTDAGPGMNRAVDQVGRAVARRIDRWQRERHLHQSLHVR